MDSYATVRWVDPGVNTGDRLAMLAAAIAHAKTDESPARHATHLIDYLQEMEKGLEIQGAWFDWYEIKHLFNRKYKRKPIKATSLELAKIVRDLAALKDTEPRPERAEFLWMRAETLSHELIRRQEEKGYESRR
jgi:hypothetical protein